MFTFHDGLPMDVRIQVNASVFDVVYTMTASTKTTLHVPSNKSGVLKWVFNLYDVFVENAPVICHCSQLYKHSWILIGCVGVSDIFFLNALIIFIWPPFTFY
jgi:hypothetical protein